MGVRGSPTGELIFEDCHIPQENLLGREGAGFLVAMKTVDKSRPGIGAQAVGIAQRALEESIAYAKTRQTFGKPIGEFQAIQLHLAQMRTDLEAARQLVHTAGQAFKPWSKING